MRTLKRPAEPSCFQSRSSILIALLTPQVVTEAHFQVDGNPLRVVTTNFSCRWHVPISRLELSMAFLLRQLPGAPFGRARREFADCMASIVHRKKLPTVLLADLNFPEKALEGWMCV